MSARDDYPAVNLMQHSPDANRAMADEINASLDEIDRLRALLVTWQQWALAEGIRL